MAYYLVRYHREALTTTGTWCSVMDGGFVSEDCTLPEIRAKVAEIVSWHDGKTGRISTSEIKLISEAERDQIMGSEMCFWSRHLSKMTVRAAEAFRQAS
jgi:hypothetical protein